MQLQSLCTRRIDTVAPLVHVRLRDALGHDIYAVCEYMNLLYSLQAHCKMGVCIFPSHYSVYATEIQCTSLLFSERSLR